MNGCESHLREPGLVETVVLDNLVLAPAPHVLVLHHGAMRGPADAVQIVAATLAVALQAKDTACEGGLRFQESNLLGTGSAGHGAHLQSALELGRNALDLAHQVRRFAELLDVRAQKVAKNGQDSA